MKKWATPLVTLLVVFLLLIVAGKAFNHFRRLSAQSAIQTQVKPTPTPTPKVVTIRTFNLVVKNNKLIAGPDTLKVNQDDHIQITITADVDGELHLHGYNIPIDFKKDEPATLSVTTNIAGRFPYELEDTKTEIGALEVQPR